MNNVEKAKLLATLFPEQLAGILEGIAHAYRYLCENEDCLRQTWQDTLITYDFWQGNAEGVHAAVTQYGPRLTKSSSLFADQLFDGYYALFTIDCILKQAKENENPKYRQAVALLFE